MENSFSYQNNNKTPSESPSLMYEEIINDQKKAFKCLAPDCEKIFRFKSDMERHVVIHTKERPYVCKYPDCKRSFKRPDALKNHSQSHCDDLPFICNHPDCGAKFHQKAALKYHLLKHNNEKFICGYPGCRRAFLTQKHLEQHQNAKTSHQKLVSCSQTLSQKDSMDQDHDYFFDNFEGSSHEQETAVSVRNSFDDEFSPKSEKFIHTETGRAAPNLNFDIVSNYSAESFDDIGKMPIPAIPDTSSLHFQDFIQKVACKYLMEENKRLKAKLATQTSPEKVDFENNISSLLNKALSYQFDLPNNN